MINDIWSSELRVAYLGSRSPRNLEILRKSKYIGGFTETQR